MQDQGAAGGGGIDPLGERAETGPSALEGLLRLDQVRHGAAEPVQLPDDQRVTFVEPSQRPVQARPGGLGATGEVFDDLLAAGLPERVQLRVEALPGR